MAVDLVVFESIDFGQTDRRTKRFYNNSMIYIVTLKGLGTKYMDPEART